MTARAIDDLTDLLLFDEWAEAPGPADAFADDATLHLVRPVQQARPRSTAGELDDLLAWAVGTGLEDDAGIAVRMAGVADALHQQDQLEGLLRTIVFSARDTVPGVDAASISTHHAPGCLVTAAATDVSALEAGELEHEDQEGPGLQAVADEVECLSNPLSEDDRWPTYGRHAQGLGIAAQLSVPLVGEVGKPLCLNLYAQTRDAFAEAAARQLARLFAVHARHAVARITNEAQLAEALGARKVIGQAVGIVMERFGVTEQQAFTLLARASGASEGGLSSLAARLTADVETKARLAAVSR